MLGMQNGRQINLDTTDENLPVDELGAGYVASEWPSKENKKKRKNTIIALIVLAILLVAVMLCIGTGFIDQIGARTVETATVRVIETEDTSSPMMTDSTAETRLDFNFPGGFANYIRWDPEDPVEWWSTPIYLEFSEMNESGEVWLSAQWYVDWGGDSEPELLNEFERTYSLLKPAGIFAIRAPLIYPDGREIYDSYSEPPIFPSGETVAQALGREVELWVYTGSSSGLVEETGCELSMDYEIHYDKSSGLLLYYREDYHEACGEPSHSYVTELVETNIPFGIGK
jgi:predicted nucleic acid-binding Zn ribbon protein